MVAMPVSYNELIFLARGKAFHFHAPPPPDIRSDRYLHSSNPREVTSSVLAAAAHGDFSRFDRLAELMENSDDAVVWGDCAMLYAYAAPYSALRRLVERFRLQLFHSDDVVTQQWISEILCRSSGLCFVPDILAIFRLNHQREQYFATPMYLSRMLEEERAHIAEGPPVLPRTDDLPAWFDVPPVYDDEGFERLIMARCAEIGAVVRDPSRVSVWEGRPLELREIARNALTRIETGEDTADISIARTWLEASTGEDLSDWYEDYQLRNLRAAASVESLLESPQLTGFETGRRYFFGRKIPD